jgi:hypothetical protein
MATAPKFRGDVDVHNLLVHASPGPVVPVARGIKLPEPAFASYGKEQLKRQRRQVMPLASTSLSAIVMIRISTNFEATPRFTVLLPVPNRPLDLNAVTPIQSFR